MLCCRQAMQVAQASCTAAAHEPDAHALVLLVLHMQGPPAVGVAQQAADAHLRLLQCDPASHLAVQVCHLWPGPVACGNLQSGSLSGPAFVDDGIMRRDRTGPYRSSAPFSVVCIIAPHL